MLTSVDSHRTPYAIGIAAPGASAGWLLESGTCFSLCSASEASDAVAWRWQAAHGRARAKEARNDPPCRRWNCRHFSALLHRKDKDLAGINKIWISDLVMVRFVNDCVSHARAVGDTADAPEAVPTGYDRGRDLGHDHGGR